MNAGDFCRFLDRLGSLQLLDQQGRAVTAAAVKDHDGAYSLYFCDPYGHRLELTTYDYARAGELLSSRRR